MSKQPPHRLVVSRPVLEIDRRRRMAELVRRDPESHRPLDPLGQLRPERVWVFGSPLSPGERYASGALEKYRIIQ